MIDIIFGVVFVVFARFLATDVVTLRCNKLSAMLVPCGVWCVVETVEIKVYGIRRRCSECSVNEVVVEEWRC